MTGLPHLKQGTNVTIEVIWRVLDMMLAAGMRIPRTFYQQLDNTVKQCKNKYMLGWMGFLILRGVFDEAHTHTHARKHTTQHPHTAHTHTAHTHTHTPHTYRTHAGTDQLPPGWTYPRGPGCTICCH
jgi:hypothetical protein